MFDWFFAPWPWYVTGPLIGLIVPALLLFDGKVFGLSENLRHICAMCIPGKQSFFCYNWKSLGLWNLIFLLGIFIGGIAASFISPDFIPQISLNTQHILTDYGFQSVSGLMPLELFAFESQSLFSIIFLIIGGFCVGFGSRWAGGCTSGHAISGLANLQLASLLAVLGFFLGGLFVVHIVFPLLFPYFL